MTRYGISPIRYFGIVLALCCAGLAGALSPSTFAAAQTPDLPPNTSPAFRAMLADPLALRAVTAARQGDFPRAAALLRDGTRHGNPTAQVLLAQMYIEGVGEPRNYAEAVRLLGLAMGKLQEPSFSVAKTTLQELDQRVKQSGSPEQKAAVNKAFIQGLLGNPNVQQFLRNQANSQFRILNCFGMVCM